MAAPNESTALLGEREPAYNPFAFSFIPLKIRYTAVGISIAMLSFQAVVSVRSAVAAPRGAHKCANDGDCLFGDKGGKVCSQETFTCGALFPAETIDDITGGFTIKSVEDFEGPPAADERGFYGSAYDKDDTTKPLVTLEKCTPVADLSGTLTGIVLAKDANGDDTVSCTGLGEGPKADCDGDHVETYGACSPAVEAACADLKRVEGECAEGGKGVAEKVNKLTEAVNVSKDLEPPCDNINEEVGKAQAYEQALLKWAPSYALAAQMCAKSEGTKEVNAALSKEYTDMMNKFGEAIEPLCQKAVTTGGTAGGGRRLLGSLRRLLWSTAASDACKDAKTRTEQLGEHLGSSSDELKVKAFNCRTAKDKELDNWAALQTAWKAYQPLRNAFIESVNKWNTWAAKLEPLKTAVTTSYATFTETTVDALAVSYGASVSELDNWHATGHCGLSEDQVAAICHSQIDKSYSKYVTSGSETCPATGTGKDACFLEEAVLPSTKPFDCSVCTHSQSMGDTYSMNTNYKLTTEEVEPCSLGIPRDYMRGNNDADSDGPEEDQTCMTYGGNPCYNMAFNAEMGDALRQLDGRDMAKALCGPKFAFGELQTMYEAATNNK